MRKAWIPLLILLGLVAGGVWFWSIGTLPPAALSAPLSVDWASAIQDASSTGSLSVLDQHRRDLEVDRLGTPGTLFYQLVLWSEHWHASFMNAQEATAARSYTLERRLVSFTQLAEQGMPGNAAGAYGRFQTEMASADTSTRMILLSAVNQALVLAGDVGPSSSAYRLKQQMEDFQVALADDPVQALLARLFAVSDRLQEARTAMDAGDKDTAGKALDAADQALANMDRDAEYWLRIPVRGQAIILGEKLDALHAWLTALRTQATPPPVYGPILVGPPAMATSTAASPSPTSTDATYATTTSSTLPVPPPKPIQPPAPAKTLQVTASQSKIGFFKSVSLSATLVSSDGTRLDVTAQTSFTVSDLSLGSLSGHAFASGQTPGMAAFTGTYVDHGVSVHGTVDVAIGQ